MARYKLQGRAVDSYGNIQPDTGITIYLAGTTTPAKVYVTETFPNALEIAPQITTDQYGRFGFWVDTVDYINTQLFDIYAGSLGYTDVDIFRGFRLHGDLSGLEENDHKQYANLTQTERVSASWTFLDAVMFMRTVDVDGNLWADRLFTKNINPSGDYELVSKNYVDNLTFNVSGATIDYVDTRDRAVSAASLEANRTLREYTDMMLDSTSASSIEQYNRQQEYIEMINSSISASSVEGDRTQYNYTNMRITSLSGATDENVSRLYEYIDLENSTQTFQISAASDEGDNRLREYTNMMLASTSASSLEQDNRTYENSTNYTDTQITSLSGATDESDQRLYEYIDSEIDYTLSYVYSITNSLTGASIESENRLYEYIDLENETQTFQISGASTERDNRLSEDIGYLTGQVRSFEASAGDSLRDLQGRLTTHEISAKGLFDEERGRLTSLEASASERFYKLDNIFVDMQDPTGFVNRTDSNISFDNSTRTFSISAVGSSFSYYIDGVVIEKTGIESIVIDDSEGSHFIYYDSEGDLNVTQTFTPLIITDYAYVTNIYWNATDKEAIYFGDERHGINWPGYVHWYHHVTEGTKYETGLQPLYINSDGTGDQEKDLYLGVSQGYIWDEDLRLTISEYTSGSPIYTYYKDGTNWRRSLNNYPVIPSGSGGITYNEITDNSGTQVLVASGGYTFAHIWATNDISEGIICIQGQNEYTSISEARSDATEAINTIFTGGLPFAEFTPIATLIYQSSPNYSNSANARIRSVDGENDYVDFRGIKGGIIITGSAGGGISSHSNLADLSSDDHLQYSRVDGTRDFTGPVGGITPVQSNDLTTKEYVDDENTTQTNSLSGAIDENINRLTEYVTLTDSSLSAASRESDNRVREYAATLTGVTSAATIQYVDSENNLQTALISAASLEDDRRLYEYVDTNIDDTISYVDFAILEVSGASLEGDNSLQDNLDAHTEDATIHFTEGSIDHGSIIGLTDDDHTQYILVDGTRAFTGTVSGATPTYDAHLSTKLYVDDNIDDTIAYVDFAVLEVSGAIDENVNRLYEYVDTETTELSGAIDENVNRLYEYVDTKEDADSAIMKTDEIEAITKLHYSSPVTLSIISEETSWDLATDSSYAKLTLTTDVTILSPSNLVDGAIFYLRIIQDSNGSHTVSYDADISFGSVDAPVMPATATSGEMIIAFTTNGIDIQCWEVWSSE